MEEQPAPAWHRCGGTRVRSSPSHHLHLRGRGGGISVEQGNTSRLRLVAAGELRLSPRWAWMALLLSVPRLAPFPGLSLSLAVSLSLLSVEHA